MINDGQVSTTNPGQQTIETNPFSAAFETDKSPPQTPLKRRRGDACTPVTIKSSSAAEKSGSKKSFTKATTRGKTQAVRGLFHVKQGHEFAFKAVSSVADVAVPQHGLGAVPELEDGEVPLDEPPDAQQQQ